MSILVKSGLRIMYGSFRQPDQPVVQFYWPDIKSVGFYQQSTALIEPEGGGEYAVAIWRVKHKNN